MKHFPNIIARLFYEPLAITKARHFAIWRVVDARLAGHGDMHLEAPGEPTGDIEDYTVIGSDAIIPVHGVLTQHASDIPASSCGCGLDKVEAMRSVAAADPSVRRLVFDFRTPGGGVGGIPELGNRIAATPKETIAFTDSECCSGGQWLASQCQRFYATESSNVGSIGVWCAYLDLSKKLASEGVNIQEFSAGKYKTMGAYWKPLTDDEKKLIQSQVDKIHTQFKSAVNLRREIASKHMEGQIFDGSEGVEVGLVDGLVDSLDDILG